MPEKLVISKTALMAGLILTLLPIWRCGLRDRLNLWQWTKEHTIFGHPVEYIPEEDYSKVGGA